jgi:quinol monooxygenase YgiN
MPVFPVFAVGLDDKCDTGTWHPQGGADRNRLPECRQDRHLVGQPWRWYGLIRPACAPVDAASPNERGRIEMTAKFFRSVRAAAISVVLVASSVARAQDPAPVGNITVLTIIDVVPDYAMADNVEKSAMLLSKLAADTQACPGLISFRILRDPKRDNHFVMKGVWKDMQSFEQYSGAETTRAFRNAFQPGAAGPFDERVYVDLK